MSVSFISVCLLPSSVCVCYLHQCVFVVVQDGNYFLNIMSSGESVSFISVFFSFISVCLFPSSVCVCYLHQCVFVVVQDGDYFLNIMTSEESVSFISVCLLLCRMATIF